MRRVLSVAVVLAWSVTALADRPVTLLHPMYADPQSVPNLINSHVLYLNRCAQGCKVMPGDTDSRTDHSDIANSAAMISAFSYGDGTWKQVVDCVKGVMAPFNITVTDVDPGTADHFEVMIAGNPGELGLPNGVGGIADYPCQALGSCNPYKPNALVFDFSDAYASTDIAGMCGTAAQEIAHAWTLDHATPSDDPMTYNRYTSPLHFRDGAQCGSDCFNCNGACTSFNVQCVGTQLNGTHVCTENNQQTQDEVQTILKLFGPAGAAAPTMSMTPKNGAGEQPGFDIVVTCTSGDGILEVDASLDGLAMTAVTAPPFKFTAPASLGNGIHRVQAICGTTKLATTTLNADVIVGPHCTGDADCGANNICYENTCIGGPMAMGGLGATCATNTDCSSMACASDGHSNLCVIPCDPNDDQCPNGFGCIMSGTAGVCWLGADKGGGCCDSGHNNSGALFAGLGFAALLVNRRKRR